MVELEKVIEKKDQLLSEINKRISESYGRCSSDYFSIDRHCVDVLKYLGLIDLKEANSLSKEISKYEEEWEQSGLY